MHRNLRNPLTRARHVDVPPKSGARVRASLALLTMLLLSLGLAASAALQPPPRTLVTEHDQTIELSRSYATCPECGAGLFPPR